MKIPEHPGAQALKLTSTRGSGNLWTIWCSAWTIDCLWSSCFKSHASVAHVASRPFLLIDVDRTLYTLTTGPMAWVVLKINLDTFWWFCMSLHVQVLLFFPLRTDCLNLGHRWSLSISCRWRTLGWGELSQAGLQWFLLFGGLLGPGAGWCKVWLDQRMETTVTWKFCQQTHGSRRVKLACGFKKRLIML